MRRFVVLPVLLALAAASFGQEPQTTPSICVKHIEAPTYFAIARAAHITGKVELKLTIDGAGRVTDARVVRGSPILSVGAKENAQRWTFAPPPSAPYSLTVVYDYGLDCTYPDIPVTKVTFDLPSLVKIVAPCMTVQPSGSKSRQ